MYLKRCINVSHCNYKQCSDQRQEAKNKKHTVFNMDIKALYPQKLPFILKKETQPKPETFNLNQIHQVCERREAEQETLL